MTDLFKVAEVDVVYKPMYKPSEMIDITSSKAVYDVIASNIDIGAQAHRERFYVMLFNNANKVLGIHKLSDGAITGCMVDMRLLFQLLVKTNSTSFIVWHNHPSGKLTPSHQDKALTNKIKECCVFMDIRLLDHLIIDCEGNYLSMADEGLM